MKYFWIFAFFCLTAPIESTHNFLRNVPSYQRLLTTQMQRKPPYGFPRPADIRKFSPKFLYWKHFLELECFKDICSRSQLKDDYRKPSANVGQWQMPSFRENYQNPNFHKTIHQYSPELQIMNKHPGKERVIFWSPEIAFGRKQGHFVPAQQEIRTGAIPRSNSSEYQRPPHPKGYLKETKATIENPEVFQEKNYSRKTAPDDEMFLKFFKKPSSVQSLPENTRGNFRPYEVEEIIEEKYEVDVDDNKEEAGTEDFRRVYQENKMTRTESNQETKHYQSIIDNSVNTILSKLIGSMSTPGDLLLPEKPEKWSPVSKAVLLRTSPNRKNFTNHPLPGKTYESVFGAPWNSQESYSGLHKTPIPTLPPNEMYNWRHKSTVGYQLLNRKLYRPDTNTRINNSRRFDFNLSSQNESHLLNVLKSDFSRYSTETEAYELPFLKIPTSKEFYTVKYPEVPPTKASERLNFFRNRTAHFQADFPRNKDGVAKYRESLNARTESPSNIFITPEITSPPSDTVEELFPEKTTVMGAFHNFEVRLNEEVTTTEAAEEFLGTNKYYPEADTNGEDVTQRGFVEFTDNPISFDLLATTADSDLKKDSETGSKNSRKMQFVHSSREPLFNDILDTAGTEQRRSDILIADNFSDYIDEENNLSSKSYFEKLKLNNSFFPFDPHNLTSDALIPLVSVVINDLRENKIPFDDISILSQALGKYWKPILALSNMTNLDMLPLLKMKNEKDLENFLQNFFLEDITPATTESSNKPDEDYSELYDYMEQYKDLYKDILGQELGKRKRFRPKRDAEDYLKTLEARREYFESLEEEQNDDENQYIFEDIMYDEMLNGDYSVFEMKKVTNVEVDSEA